MIECSARIGRVPETAESIVAACSAARQPTTWPGGERLRERVITALSLLYCCTPRSCLDRAFSCPLSTCSLFTSLKPDLSAACT
jgi:hypothetical protein